MYKAYAALTSISPALAEIPPLTILFLSPFGIMEIIAYSIAMSRSLLLIVKVIKKVPIKPDLRNIILEIIIVVGLLTAGGYLEAYMIDLVQESGFEMPGFQ